MNIKSKLSFILVFSFITIITATASDDSIFTTSSLLSKGRWVKITTRETGLYEISHQKLRELGFSNPDKVGVFGHGAQPQPENFKENSGKTIFNDDLRQIASAHFGDKLVFYGQGPESIYYDPEKEAFLRDNRNLWTEYGHYFLSECTEQPIGFETPSTPADPNDVITEISSAKAYMYHDLDISLGAKGSGRMFLGEAFNHTAPQDPHTREVEYTWPYSFPDMITGSETKMMSLFYLQGGKGGVLSFGAKGGSNNYSKWKLMRISDYTLEPFISEPVDISLPGSSGDIFMNFALDGRHASNTTYCHLDYWTVTYESRIPTLSNSPQTMITIPGVSGRQMKITLAAPSHRLLDVSHPERPVLSVPSSGNQCTLTASADNPSYIVFDLARKLMEPLAYNEISNQNLHAMDTGDTDFLIFTMPEYLDGANRLAELHRQYDDINTTIVEVPELYNEFSSGNPDPMAYRAFAKMVYERSAGKLRNIVLIGPAEANLKIDAVPGTEPSKMLFYQYGHEAPLLAGSNAIDFYASFDDYTTASLERRRLATGIGIIPCRSQAELENYIEKVERFLSDDTYAYRINRVLYAGGKGDSNMHIRQADEFATRLDAISDKSYSFNPISDSYFDPEQARSRFLKSIDQSGFVYFLGHGSTSHIDSRINLILMKDLRLFQNRNTPFMALCGCDLTNSDRGNRGISETMVITNPNALIAALTSFRESYASSNSTMLNHLGTVMATPLPDPYTSRTIGEMYQYMKNNTFAQNELTYTIVGDPAIKIPSPLNDIHLDSETTLPEPGNTLTLSGRITDTKGNTLDRFNGEIVGRLLSSTATIELAPDYESKSDTIPYLKYAPPREVLTISSAKVENGIFSLSIRIPKDAQAFRGKGLQLAFGAFSPEYRTGAGLTIETDFNASSSQPSATPADNIPPQIEVFEYDVQSNALNLLVSDNEALNLSELPFSNGLTLFIDGKIFPKAYSATRLLDHNRPAYSTSIPLPPIADGPHQATVEVTDEAGNSASSSISFFVGHKTSARLDLHEEAVITQATFIISDIKSLIPDSVILIVTGPDGEIITHKTCSADSLIWDLTDDSGQRVPAGLYRAVVRAGDSDHSSFISTTAVIPVLPQ